ncbi:uncharacterized protein LOC116029699 [Ipomoea triloba]|uniref:uncharacterized protein LOC116029699 n=1 Tax=Ipomoea triloba TaxID=35885 RepID=UPI00125E0622|nr:uncharacterized protein LOC116029699 [Ipomoea triloba]
MGGGLALFWRDKDIATLLSYSQNYIDVIVTLPSKPQYRLTCFYGFPERTRRQQSWDLLRQLKGQSTLPWIVLGDFNDLLYHSEKRGPNPHPESLMMGFGDALQDCRLMDLGMMGNQFTWERGRGTEAWVEERLDRAVATLEWSDIFEEVSPTWPVRKKFRFEAAWLLDDGCRIVVEHAWGLSIGMEFQERVFGCGQRLWRWGREHFKKFGNRISQLRKRLISLKENRFPWRQRSKQLWLKNGDNNTKYFHKSATARKRSNHLSRIKTQDGEWVDGLGLNEEILRYFSEIFTSATPATSFFHNVQSHITEDMNMRLLRPFTVEEVKLALFDMAPNKAPGPDGMTPAFYQRFWSVVGHDLSCFVLNCLHSATIPHGLNGTNIVLIPKKRVPERVSDLRPIALCNVAYKFLAKVVANRMKEVLDCVISPNQSAFVQDILLSDNIIVAGEIGHYLKRTRQGNVGWAALKLDMAKAYDRMEWGFLEGMLHALDFHPDWTKLVMLCVTTIRYNITVNGEVAGTVVQSRGIRQGDPLSPYLFILCAEGLSVLLNQAERRGDIHGIKVARGAPAVSHLLFADDSLLFFKAIPREVQVVKNILDMYCGASGQAINFDKSSIMFSSSTATPTKEFVADILGVRVANDLGKYLGLPSFMGRNKSVTLRFIEQKITERMERAMNRYWWESGNATSRGIHWLSWDRMCLPKCHGGLGFKKLHEFNIALLAKQGWRLLLHPESLVGRLMKARYYPNCDFLHAQLGANPSYIWQSVLASQSLLREGIAKRIGDGKDTAIWGWPWLSDVDNPSLVTPCIDNLREAKVSGLIDEAGNWDGEIVRDLFVDSDVARILATPISPQFKDTWRWKGDWRGVYAVRHGYRILTSSTFAADSRLCFIKCRQLWKLPVPPKVKNFIWRCMRSVLPVREVLKTRHVWAGSGCPFCVAESETMEHLFCACPQTKQVWDDSSILFEESLPLLLNKLFDDGCLNKAVHAAAILWIIWCTRNDVVWNEGSWSIIGMRRQVAGLREVWHTAYSQSAFVHATIPSPYNWSPPTENLIKCNVDAAVNDNGASYGVVIQDHNGKYVDACDGRLGLVRDPLLAETMAAKEALSWLKASGYSNLIFETDCLTFCNSFHSNSSDLSYVGVLVKQCCDIARDIENVYVHHVRRSANHVAHVLARAAGSLSGSRSWGSVPPACISHLRIGDGKDTAIWGWPWLSDVDNPSLVTPCIDNLREAKVSGLIDEAGNWDGEIVRDLFVDSDVARILATPISPQFKDTWRWKGDWRGVYAVRHGYRILTSSTFAADSRLCFIKCRQLWKLPVPPKVKNFIWRCMRSVLPVREVLKTRHVWAGSGCPFCVAESETMEHLFCACPQTKQVWDDSSILFEESLPLLLNKLFDDGCLNKAVHAAAILWIIWCTRNDVVWNEGSWSIIGMRRQVAGLREVWHTAYSQSAFVHATIPSPYNWSPPTENLIKCNVDAAVNDNGASYGVVIQDHNGKYVDACDGRLGLVRDPLLAETMAAKEALSWLKASGYSNLIFETDCLTFCNSFHSNSSDLSYVGVLVKQCCDIARDIENVYVHHVRRSANHVAHVLARAAGSLSGSRSWGSVPPACISHLVDY